MDLSAATFWWVAAGVAELVDGRLRVSLREPLRGVAPGQTMVLYRPDPAGDEVLGSATLSLTDGEISE